MSDCWSVAVRPSCVTTHCPPDWTATSRHSGIEARDAAMGPRCHARVRGEPEHLDRPERLPGEVARERPPAVVVHLERVEQLARRLGPVVEALVWRNGAGVDENGHGSSGGRSLGGSGALRGGRSPRVPPRSHRGPPSRWRDPRGTTLCLSSPHGRRSPGRDRPRRRRCAGARRRAVSPRRAGGSARDRPGTGRRASCCRPPARHRARISPRQPQAAQGRSCDRRLGRRHRA